MAERSTERSSLYRLIERQLGEGLAGYVSVRRPTQSWRAIAGELGERIGVEVSYESLRLWFGDNDENVA